MIHTCIPEKIRIYHNTDGKLPEQIKRETGCTTIFNGVLFEGSGALCCDVRIDGKTVANDEYSYWGYAWSGTELPVMVNSLSMHQYDNFVSCICAIKSGEKQAVNDNDKDVGGTRGRTAFGFKTDGSMIILGTSDNAGAMKLSEARDKLFDLGCQDALILDGGGSCYLSCPAGTVDTFENRKRGNRTYILVWEKGDKSMDTSTKLKGIDVSVFQGVINWEAVKPQIDFAMIQAGFGRNNIDKQFLRNIQKCNRLGIPCGIYWFSYALTVEDAKREAQYCLAAIKDYKVELPIAFDFEYASVDYAKKNGVTIGKPLATAMLTAFCEEIEKAGYFAMMYTNGDYLNRYFDKALTQRFALWLATYPGGTVNFDNPPRECGIWQYSSTGIINGINGNVDMNVAYKDFAAWIKELGLNHLEAPATPEAPIKPTEPVVDKVEEAIKKLRAAGYDDVLVKLAALIK